MVCMAYAKREKERRQYGEKKKRERQLNRKCDMTFGREAKITMQEVVAS